MSRPKKILRNIIILVGLTFLFLRSRGLYLTPLSAHRASERSAHYGPSEIIHIEDFEKGKYILCKYDKWISCNPVNKSFFIFWSIDDEGPGIENDKTKALNFTWGMSRNSYRFYGIINDYRINKIEVLLDDDQLLTQTEFYDAMFLFAGSIPNNSYPYFKTIKGYDSEGNLIFQHEY